MLSTSARVIGTIGPGAAFAAPAFAAGPGAMDVTITHPATEGRRISQALCRDLQVEKAGASAKTVAVWYDYDMKANEGTKWLQRRTPMVASAAGRFDDLPGERHHGCDARAGRAQDIVLACPTRRRGLSGQYTLVIEAAREVHGPELLRIPLHLAGKGRRGRRAAGTTELGRRFGLPSAKQKGQDDEQAVLGFPPRPPHLRRWSPFRLRRIAGG